MDEYADIYYVDERNAVVTTDHRTGSTSGKGPFGFAFPRPPAQPVRTVYVASPSHPRPVMVGAPAPMIYSPQQMPPQSTAATLLGKLTTGQIVEMIAQIFAALQSLPGAPVATKDAATDVGNLILFQNALAQHAKRDEQVRTLGSLVARLVG
jgi:hypothetical protein